MKANGYDRSAGRVNGHATISPSGAAQDTPQLLGRAASDDAREFPNAAAASSAAAGTERVACAEVARPPEGDKEPGPKEKEKKNGKKNGEKDEPRRGTSRRTTRNDGELMDIPPGSAPLAPDGPSFVDDMHAHVDLYIACARLVKSKDEKIAQRMVERLLEMSYGKSPAPPGDEPPQIIFDAPRPLRD
ncbi:MAG TPA: hypothetical protein VKH15_15595 [Candidatus Acidoferrum sp.]|nr:hypothetical protein [Candidatus Acidoferrum sp.]